MLSPAAQHRVKVEAGLEIKTRSPGAPVHNSQYRAYLYKLKADQARLRKVRSQKSRLELKSALLPEYTAYLDGVLLSGTDSKSGNDDVLLWCALWYLDIGEIKRGLQLAAHGLHRGMDTPNGFKRSLLETLTEETCNAILKLNPADYLSELAQLAELAAGKDMQDGIKAKLFKAYGLALSAHDPEQAESYLMQAHALQPAVGVKGHLKKLQQGRPLPITETSADAYTIPTSQAAKMICKSVPTFLKYVSMCPVELPYVCFESGKHKAFRFRESDIKKFIQRRTFNEVRQTA